MGYNPNFSTFNKQSSNVKNSPMEINKVIPDCEQREQ